MNKTLILAAIIILGFALRAYHINSWGIWNDEQATVLIANGEIRYFINNDTLSEGSLNKFTNIDRHARNTLHNVLDATIHDNGNSFAYNLLLHYWLLIFGVSDVSVRLLALIFGLLIIPLAYRFSLEVFKDKNAALIIAFLFAIHPLFIEYSIMCRAYTMGTFFSLLSTYFFYRIITSQAKSKTYLFYILAVSVSLLTHYLTSYVFIAQGIIFLLYVRDKNIWSRYIVAGVFIVAIFAAWMYLGGIEGFKVLDFQNAGNRKAAQMYKPGDIGGAAFSLPPNPKNILTGWIEVWLQLFGNQFEYFDFLRVRNIAILLVVPFFLILTTIRLRKNTPEGKIIIGLLIMTFTQTIYATLEAIRAGHCKGFHPLYTNFAVPYAIMLLGYAIYTCFQKSNLKIVTLIFTVLIVTIAFISYIPTFNNARGIYPDKKFHRISANEIMAKYQKGDTVSIKSNIDAKIINLYLPNNIEIDQKIDTNITELYLIPGK